MSKIKKGYTKLPIKVFSMELSPYAAVLYCFLLSLSEEFDPGLKFLSSTLKLSRNTVIKYMKELESRNMIKKYQTGSVGCFSKYEFIPVKDWL